MGLARAGWLAVLGAAACSALVDLPASSDAAASSAAPGVGGSTTSQGGAATTSSVGGGGGGVPLTGDHMWSRRFGGLSYDDPGAVTVDAAGNVYVVGSFRGVVDFGSGPFDAGNTAHAFVLKLDPQGNHVWSRQFGGVSGFTSGVDIAVASSGDVFVCGAFTGTVDFGDGPKTSDLNADGYVVHLGAQGNFIASQHFAGPGVQVASSIGLDNAGNVLVAGDFDDSIDVDGDVVSTLQNDGSFVVKHSAAGAWMWSALITGPTTSIWDMAVASDDSVLFVGYFSDYVNVAGGNLLGNGSYDILVAKLSSAGVHLWSRNAGDDQLQFGRSIAVGPSGGPAVTGFFAGSVDFGGGPQSSAGFYDAFAAQLSSGGGHVWTKVLGNPNDQEGAGIAIDSGDYVVNVGRFQGTLDAGGPRMQSVGENDAFIVKRNAAGEHVWSKSFGGPSDDGAFALGAGPDDTLVVAGSFTGSVDFGGGPLVSDGPERDAFVVKLAP